MASAIILTVVEYVGDARSISIEKRRGNCDGTDFIYAQESFTESGSSISECGDAKSACAKVLPIVYYVRET